MKNWWQGLKGKVSFKEPLKNKTTFRIGGQAELFFEPKDTADLKLLLNLKKRCKLPLLVLGAGSNILVSDKGVKGVVLRLDSAAFKKISFNGSKVEAGSGVPLNKIIRSSVSRGLSGLGFIAGMPGTLGGALLMNAGIPGRSLSDLVEKITVMDYNGKVKVLGRKDLILGYRKSNLGRYIILSARLKLVKKDKLKAKNELTHYLKRRCLTQDLSSPSAGCIFKNPKDNSAGRLIDLCGLKGKAIGRAVISPKHANFIVSLGRAQAKDVLRLMDLAKKEVRKKFAVVLEPEIKIWK